MIISDKMKFKVPFRTLLVFGLFLGTLAKTSKNYDRKPRAAKPNPVPDASPKAKADPVVVLETGKGGKSASFQDENTGVQYQVINGKVSN